MLLFHCALTFHYESRVLTFPLNPPLGKGGLGPATQDSRTQKNGLLFCLLSLCLLSFHCALTFHYESRVLTFPLNPPLGKGGLGPATQDSRTLKNGLLFCYLLLFGAKVFSVVSVFQLLTTHY